MAEAFVPGEARPCERKVLRSLLHADGARSMDALGSMWKVQTEFENDKYSEEALHARPSETEPSLRTLLEAA